MHPVISRQRAAAQRRTDRSETTGHPQPTRSGTNAKYRLSRLTRRQLAVLSIVIAAIPLMIVGYVSRDRWTPHVRQSLARVQLPLLDREPAASIAEGTGHDADDGDAHALEANLASTSLKLSEQARKNVGLSLVNIKLQDFERTVNVPATVKERPGRTSIKVSAPMTGIVTRIYPIRGEAVTPGQRLFDLLRRLDGSRE